MPPQQQQGGGDENGPIWMGILAVALLVGLWYFYHPVLVYVYFKIKYFEILPLNFFIPELHHVTESLRTMTIKQAGQYSLTDVMNICAFIGTYFRYPCAAIAFAYAFLIYNSHATLRYKSTYSMNVLANAEKVDWPQITPVVNLDLVKTPIDEGPWAMSMTPMQFAKRYHLLEVEQTIPDQNQLSTNVKLIAKIRHPMAKQVFLMQLGNYWRSFEQIPIHFRALIAIFTAKAFGDQDAYLHLNNQIAASSAKGGQLNFAGTDELLAKYKDKKEVQDIINRHAFVYTVMASMLQLGRQSGVLASADFLWLKPIDRRLWYILNNVGRKTPVPEVAGIFAHWNTEILFARKIAVPMVDEAVDALEIGVSEIIYKEDDRSTEHTE